MVQGRDLVFSPFKGYEAGAVTVQGLGEGLEGFIEALRAVPLSRAIQDWLSNLNPGTARNYAYYVSDLIRRGILPDVHEDGRPVTVGDFNRIPHERVIDYIKRIPDWAEGTRQVKAACYISLTAYLNRVSNGWFRRAIPSTLASNPTFFTVRDKCATEALSLHDAHRFLDMVTSISFREGLIAKMLLQGAKRVSEVLTVRLPDVDFNKGLVRFVQSKTGGMLKETYISFPESFLQDLQGYLQKSSSRRSHDGLVFITRGGRGVCRSRVNYVFEIASRRLGWWRFDKAREEWEGRKVAPHMLRATWVTHAKQQGVPDTEIMKVTGHASSKMIYSYDKTSLQDNYTKRLVLV